MLLRLTTLTVALAALTSCGSFERIDVAAKKGASDYAEATSHGKAQRERQRGLVARHDTPWVSFDALPRNRTSAKIPSEIDCPIRFISDIPMGLADFSSALGTPCGQNVRISPDAWSFVSPGQGQGSMPYVAPMTVPSVEIPPLPPRMGPAAASGQVPFMSSMPMMPNMSERSLSVRPIKWLDKPLSGLLDAATSMLGLSWTYRDGTIEIRHLESRTFVIESLASVTNFRSVVSSGTSLSSGSTGSSGGGSGGGSSSSGAETTGESSQETTIEVVASLEDDLKRSIESALSPYGKYALMKSTGTLTVTDTVDGIGRIERIVNDVNTTMGRQVTLDVTVAMVKLNDSDSLGINWNAVFNSMNGNFGVSLTNPFSPLQGASSAGFGVLETATGSASQFRGSRAVLDALATQGNVSIYKQRNVTTANMQPSPIQMTEQEQYICNRSLTNTAQVGSTEGVELCSVVTGFSMELLPYIIDPSQLTLQFGMNMSPPAVIETIPGDPLRPIQKASVARQVFQQRVRLRSNQTLVLSDYQESSQDASLRGAGGITSAWPLLGGGNRQAGRTVVVIMITPYIESSLPTSRGVRG